MEEIVLFLSHFNGLTGMKQRPNMVLNTLALNKESRRNERPKKEAVF